MLPKRLLIALVATLLAAPALAQTGLSPTGLSPTAPVNPRVRLQTPEGAIVLELFADKAPVTAKNFLRYVDAKRFDGATFYRASTPTGSTVKDYGILQGGLQNDPKKVFPPIPHESTLKTGLSHTDGTISMGRHAPGTAQADFTICVGDQTYLDADPKDPKNPGFAAFGRVVEGMEVVRKILAMPTDPKKGVGVMKGEMLARPVPITSARRIPASAP